MQISTTDLERVFKTLEIVPKHSTHHVAGYLVVDGRRILAVHYSRGRGDMTGPVAEQFRKSLYLTKGEFHWLVSGELTRREYLDILRARGILKRAG